MFNALLIQPHPEAPNSKLEQEKKVLFLKRQQKKMLPVKLYDRSRSHPVSERATVGMNNSKTAPDK